MKLLDDLEERRGYCKVQKISLKMTVYSKHVAVTNAPI
jgi:hypothetical protein